MASTQICLLRSPQTSNSTGSNTPYPKTYSPRMSAQCRSRNCDIFPSFAVCSNSLNFPHNGAGLTGGPSNLPKSRDFSGNRIKLLRTGKATAELRTPLSVAGIVESIKWAFTSPATWESTVIATSTIFVAGAPILLAGLSLSGYCSAYLLALLTWWAFGGQGTSIVAVYFLLGTGATKVKIKQKEAAGIAEQRGGRRGPGSVFGSWTAGALCAVGALAGLGGAQWATLWKLGFLASFCTKLSDTISSEIGKAYGKTTYLVTTLSIVPRGTEGAVSLEGTIAGLIASIILAGVAYSINLTDQSGAIICVLAAQVANLCESYIGAALQGREGFEWITNDIANILNITIGASLAMLIRWQTG